VQNYRPFFSFHSSQLEGTFSLYEFPTWWLHIVLYIRTDSNSCLISEIYLYLTNYWNLIKLQSGAPHYKIEVYVFLANIIYIKIIMKTATPPDIKYKMAKSWFLPVCFATSCSFAYKSLWPQWFCRVHCVLLEYVSYVCSHLKSELLRMQCQLAAGKATASTCWQ